MESYTYLIIGGGMAGGRGAENTRKVDPEGTIALVTVERHMPYDRPPLSKGYLVGTESLDHVYLRKDSFYDENKIEVLRGVRATGIDPVLRRVTLNDGRVLGYGKLLLATGGRARRLPLPGSALPGIFILRTIDDADTIREAAQPGRRALVVGGSFIGSEGAACLAQRGVEVTMVFPEQRLLARVSPEEFASFVRSRFEGRGVRLLTGRRPARFEGEDRVRRAVLDDGTELDIDLVLLGVGIRLNTELARAAGLALDERGAVLVDEFLRTSDSHIYAAGDIAAWPDPTFGKRLRVEHWDVARRQGIRAGRNMAGDEKPYTALPYFYSDMFDLNVEAWGDLGQWDQTVRRGALESDRSTLYYFYQGRLVGALTVGRIEGEEPATHETAGGLSKEERQALQALIRARPAYEEVADRLRDETVDLGTLVE